ncbi:MAG: iron-containing alcohol dehydrogenase [Chloroflexi bacterium]|nr:iron-containing alcohol dehydrogenase [Chloroflexota bacterium]
MEQDIAFEMAASSIRFGWGVTREVGLDLAELGAKRVMVVTDPMLRELPPVATVLTALEDAGVPHVLFDRVQIEPTDASFQAAIAFAVDEGVDAYVAVGGGSTIDTAKAANLYATYPADFLDYVNAPIGKGLPVPGPLKPLIAIPTTAGTGSETTGTAIFDLVSMHAKTGISHRNLKPLLGIIDPENTATLSPTAVASTGCDVLSHALESYTAIAYTLRPYPERPILRPAYQGSNPVSDLWSGQTLAMVAEFLPRAMADPEDREAREQMLLAASFAGIGFGNAGVHLPHGMSYPVAGMVRDYHPDGYAGDQPIVPHGFAVVLNAPAVFRFTAAAGPTRHTRAAELLGADVSGVMPKDAGKVLSDRLIELMQELRVPNGLSAVGYTSADIPALVEGTLPQHRVTKLSPRQATADDLARMFEDAMRYW